MPLLVYTGGVLWVYDQIGQFKPKERILVGPTGLSSNRSIRQKAEETRSLGLLGKAYEYLCHSVGCYLGSSYMRQLVSVEGP